LRQPSNVTCSKVIGTRDIRINHQFQGFLLGFAAACLFYLLASESLSDICSFVAHALLGNEVAPCPWGAANRRNAQCAESFGDGIRDWLDRCVPARTVGQIPLIWAPPRLQLVSLTRNSFNTPRIQNFSDLISVFRV